MAQDIQHIIRTNTDIPLKERFDFWRYLVELHYDASPLENDASMAARKSSYLLGDIVLSSAFYMAHRGVRSPLIIAKSTRPQYYLQLITHGQISGTLDKIDVVMNTGDIYLTDIQRPSDMCGSKGSTISVVLDHQLLQSSVGYKNLHGAIIRCGTPKAVILTSMLTEIITLLELGNIEQLLYIQDALVAMISCCFIGAAVSDDELSSTMKMQLLAYIHDNLTNAELNVHAITKALHISRSSIYRYFEPEGGIASYVRQQRLARGLKEIQKLGRAKNVKSLAYSLGFKSPAQFSSSFKARFGVSPSELTNETELPSEVHATASAFHFHLT